jgi:hypothetical protein
MRHLDDGTLRRMVDEPLILPARARQHYVACARCRSRYTEIAKCAHEVAALLAVPDSKNDSVAALAVVRQRAQAKKTMPKPQWYKPIGLPSYSGVFDGRGLLKPLGAVAITVALVVAIVLTPAGSLAQSFLTIFQPKQLVMVPITPGELRTLPNLRQFGTLHVSKSPKIERVTSAVAASMAAGMNVLTPASLPVDVPRHVIYQIIPGTTSSFTFSAAKARAMTARTGKPLPAMPRDLDGSTLQLRTGTAVVAIYGQRDEIPAVVVAQTRAPIVTSTGASVRQIEHYLLHLPGVSPHLAQEIEAIGDPSTTLPIPVPVNRAIANHITVQGTDGLLIGDNTGIASVVIWQKERVIYAVGGSLTESQVLAVANSLR